MGYEPELEEEEKCRVSMVTMAYNNAYIIKQLQKRGEYIRDEDYKNLDKLQEAMLEKLKEGYNHDKSDDGHEHEHKHGHGLRQEQKEHSH
jgi:exosome complex RNA-binding protein Rrp42 (RNase PH superfamily)